MNIKKIKSTICILTAGVGSRMGIYSDIINKSLLPIEGKAAISHIIENFNIKSTFVIGLGYKSDQVKNYLNIAHPKHNFVFVKINNYNGENSGPGLSLYKCKKYLNKDFFFISCDTLLNKKNLLKINLNENFVGTYPVKSKLNHYCNFILEKNKVIDIYDKKIPPKNKRNVSFIGFCYIKDHIIFWKSLSKNFLIKNEMQISNGFIDLIKKNLLISKTIKWIDLGNYTLYKNYVNKNLKYDFSKNDEFIYFINKKVIKFNTFSEKNKSKIIKYNLNKKIFPNNIKLSNNFLSYNYINGSTFYTANSREKFRNLLLWLSKNLWINKINDPSYLSLDAKNFYKIKTIDRSNLFLKSHNYLDKVSFINSKKVKKINFYLNKVNWKYLETTIPSFTHGDLQFDNIIYFKEKFTLIDWRESFNTNIKYGDLYYDLAKLYGGMHINYDYIKKNYMNYSEGSKGISFYIKTRKIMKNYIYDFENFVIENNLQMKKIKLLLPIIFLNMSPLHNFPFNKILFSYSKMLFEDFFSQNDY